MRLFISYAREDKFQVRKIVEILQSGGHDPWFDYRLMPGQDWQAELLKAIDVSEAFVYMLSPASISSKWCEWEFSKAIQLRKPIVPVLLKECAIPKTLAAIQYADFSQSISAKESVKLIGGIYSATIIPPENAPIVTLTSEEIPQQVDSDVDKVISLYNAAQLHELITFEGHEAWVEEMHFISDERLVSGAYDGMIKLWDLPQKQEVTNLLTSNSGINSIALSPDRRYLAYALNDESESPDLGIIDLAQMKEIKRIIQSDETGQAWQIVFSPDKELLYVPRFNIIRPYQISSMRFLRIEFQSHSEIIWTLDVSSDGTVLALGDDNGEVMIWGLVGSTNLFNFIYNTEVWVHCVKFSPDSAFLAAGYSDGTIKIWDIDKRSEYMTLIAHRDSITYLSWSPDGTLLASSSYDKSVRLWDIKTRKQLTILKGHDRAVLSVAFSPSGTLLASGSEDCNIKIWGL